ncbi:MAG: M14 family zinc carboxypeptidase [Pyrinomonadaceae bacterium]
MRQFAFVLLAALAFSMNANSQSPEKLALLWDSEHVSRLAPSDVRHTDLKRYLDGLRHQGIKVDQVGFSNASREIYQIEYGTGPLKVLMWSQMHGDEPTATSALIDMFAFLRKHRDTAWVKKISETMTIRAVPMLNPDGAEIYHRRNLQDIDINRDAVELRTPEARLLKQLRDVWNPAIGFNLHNQNALTTVGLSTKQAAISLLVVHGDEAKTTSFGHERNARVAAAITQALQPFIAGHIGRYDDEWTSSAFGDNFSAWGTPVILIETGALVGRDEMYLVRMNFIAFLTALRSLASGAEKTQSVAAYWALPENTSGLLADFVFRRATVASVDDQLASFALADISAVTLRRRASFQAPTIIRSVSEGISARGLAEYDASSFYAVHRYSAVKAGELAELFFYRRGRAIDWLSTEMEKQFPPDAIFSAGKWRTGEGVVPKR